MVRCNFLLGRAMLCPPLDRSHAHRKLLELMPHSLPPPPDLRVDEIALFLDVDGTLVEIEREPGAVHVPERLSRVLADLFEAGGGALALVSGRSLEQLDRLFSPLRLSAAGLHGLERRNLATGVVRREPDRAVFEPARARLDRFRQGPRGRAARGQGPDARAALSQGARARGGSQGAGAGGGGGERGRSGAARGQEGPGAEAARLRQGRGDRRLHGGAAVSRPASGVRRRRRHRRGGLRDDQPPRRHLDPDRGRMRGRPRPSTGIATSAACKTGCRACSARSPPSIPRGISAWHPWSSVSSAIARSAR